MIYETNIILLAVSQLKRNVGRGRVIRDPQGDSRSRHGGVLFKLHLGESSVATSFNYTLSMYSP